MQTTLVLTHVQHKCSREESSQAFMFPVVSSNFHDEPPVVMYAMEVTKRQRNLGGHVKRAQCKESGTQVLVSAIYLSYHPCGLVSFSEASISLFENLASHSNELYTGSARQD